MSSSFWPKKPKTSEKPSKNEPKKINSKKKQPNDSNRDQESGASKPPSRVASPSSSSKKDDACKIHWAFRAADSTRPQVLGFENDMLSLKKLLRRHEENDNQFKAVGIIGARGIGKTTLCQEYVEKYMKEVSLPRVWVSMSRPNGKDDQRIAVLKRMCQSFGVEDEKITNNVSSNDEKLKALLYALRLQLIGKRYLIVLDDVRELFAYPWYENLHEQVPISDKSGSTGTGAGTRIAYALPKGSGGTVIVTSRAEDIAKKMVGEANMHRVLPLSDPENLWLIFCDTIVENGDQKTGKKDKLKQKLKDIITDDTEMLLSGKTTDDILLALREKVITTCNGVPAAAKVMAETMHEQLEKQAAKQEKKAAEQEEKKKIAQDQVEKEGVPKETGLIQEKNVIAKEEPLDDEDVPRETKEVANAEVAKV